MTKRILAFVALAVLALGTATAAWAQTSGERGAKREALRDCVEQAKAAQPDADRATLKPAVKSCMEAKGITLGERRAKRRACFQQAKADHAGDRQAIRQAVRECMGRE